MIVKTLSASPVTTTLASDEAVVFSCFIVASTSNVTDLSKVTFVAATGMPADQLPAVDHLSSTAPVKLDAV